MLRFAIPLAATFALTGCQTTNSTADWGRTTTYNRTVLSGQTIRIQYMHDLSADCQSNGRPTLKVATGATGGTITFRDETGFSNYEASNVRSKCNTRRSPTAVIYYNANPAFKGQDFAKVEVFWRDGDVWTYNLNITVR